MSENHSIYVHIPFCKARCGYCAFCSCTDMSLVPDYFGRLSQEMAVYSDRSKPIYTLYIGGGTPSSVPVRYIDGLLRDLDKYFDLSELKETTVECNPESTTRELLDCLAAHGVNRVSFGLQSVNDATLERIGRLHNYADFLAATELARNCGIDNINADLIIGLPESRADFRRSLDRIASLPVTHVSAYALELHEHTALYDRLAGQPPFDDDSMADMYDEALATLREHGFARYEISNFARTGYECLHNLNYWQEGRYFAFGASASGFVDDVRFVNTQDIGQYMSLPIGELRTCTPVSLHEQAEEFVMLGLRLESGVNLDEFARRYGKDLYAFFPHAEKLEKRGCLCSEAGHIRVPADKFYVVNSILADLLDDEAD